jgi:hypothetical protein
MFDVLEIGQSHTLMQSYKKNREERAEASRINQALSLVKLNMGSVW